MLLSFLLDQKLESVYGDLKFFLKDITEDVMKHILHVLFYKDDKRSRFSVLWEVVLLSNSFASFYIIDAWAPMTSIISLFGWQEAKS